MKRILALTIAAMLLLGGCGVKENNDSKKPAEHTEKGIQIGGVTLNIGGVLTDEKKEALGEPISTSEAPSCLYEGFDIVYEYEGFTLQTNQQSEDEIVCILTVETEKYPTAQGVKVGDTAEAVREAYGEAEEDTKYYLTYTVDNTAITFSLSSGKVSAIEYAVPS